MARFESWIPSHLTAHSSSGLGHLPLKEEITGSNPVCATILVVQFLLIPGKAMCY